MTNPTDDDMPDGTQRPADDNPGQDQPPASAGARLKWARERAGLTVNDVAARLRLHPAQVRALESETFKALPEAAYVRGFVRSYARIVDLPVEPLLADLAPKLGPTSTDLIERMTRERDYSPVRAAASLPTARVASPPASAARMSPASAAQGSPSARGVARVDASASSSTWCPACASAWPSAASGRVSPSVP